MPYRDSKCNIGLYKIGVKLFGRLFDLSSAAASSSLLFEGCNLGGPGTGSSRTKGNGRGVHKQESLQTVDRGRTDLNTSTGTALWVVKL